MTGFGRLIWAPALAVSLVAAGCAANSPLGGVLGGLGLPGGQSTVSGTVAGVNTRSQQVFINMDNGQQLAVQYDNQTQVVYQNQSYPVPNLQRGDYVNVQIQGTGNGGYYTSYIQVQQSVSSSGNYPGNYGTYGGAYGSYTTLQGTVRQIDYQNGAFLISQRNGATVWVTMPYNPRREDAQIFNSLRSGQYVRIYGQFTGGNQFRLSNFQ